MSEKRHAQDAGQPFAFHPENLERAQHIIGRYPTGRQQSAVMPLLMLAQKQHDNWVPREAMDYIADMLGMAPIRVYEVASFYTMYNLAPVGRHVVEVCTTTPCWLRGSDQIVGACKKRLGVEIGGTSADGLFTLREAECLGACVNAPMVQIGPHYYEDLDEESMTALLDALAAGKTPPHGPQTARRSSEPLPGLTTLRDEEAA